MVELFVAKDHLRDFILFLLDIDQALTTDQGLSMQRAWHGTCNVDRMFCPIYHKINDDVMMMYAAFTLHLTRPLIILALLIVVWINSSIVCLASV